MIDAGIPPFFGLGLEEGHVLTFWLLLYCSHDASCTPRMETQLKIAEAGRKTRDGF